VWLVDESKLLEVVDNDGQATRMREGKEGKEMRSRTLKQINKACRRAV
jgi:hypothetical protein